MRIPEAEALNAMAELIASCGFDQITDPNNRARIVELCIAADQAEQLNCIVYQLEEIDGSLAPLHAWFQKSDEYRRF